MPSLNRQQQKVIQHRLERAAREEKETRYNALRKVRKEKLEALQVRAEETAALADAQKKIAAYRRRVLDPLLEDFATKGYHLLPLKENRWQKSPRELKTSDPIEYSVVTTVYETQCKEIEAEFSAGSAKLDKQFSLAWNKIEDIMFDLIIGEGTTAELVANAINSLKAIFNQ